MRYPEFIKKNETIGLVAPSFGAGIEPYISTTNHAIEVISDRGYAVKEGPCVRALDGVGISSTPDNCAKEFMDFYTDEEISGLISAGGGELMCQVVSRVNWDVIATSKPKWFMGFSDNTNFTYLLTTLCDVAAIYGPCISTFGQKNWHQATKDAFNMITGASCDATVIGRDKADLGAYDRFLSEDEKTFGTIIVQGYDSWEKESLKSEETPIVDYNLTEKKELVFYNCGSADANDMMQENPTTVRMSGRLLGGCIDCLNNIKGTKYDKTTDFIERYKDDGIIWFLEACELNVFDIARSLWSMREAGWFEHASGFIIGRPMLYNQPMMGLDQYKAVTDALGDLNVPIIMDADLGHLPPSMPLISGSIADVVACGNEIEVKMCLK